MSDQGGHWITIHGAHVFISDAKGSRGTNSGGAAGSQDAAKVVPMSRYAGGGGGSTRPAEGSLNASSAKSPAKTTLEKFGPPAPWAVDQTMTAEQLASARAEAIARREARWAREGGTPIPALRLKSGKIIQGESGQAHWQLMEKNKVTPWSVEDTGWTFGKKGEFHGSEYGNFRGHRMVSGRRRW